MTYLYLYTVYNRWTKLVMKSFLSLTALASSVFSYRISKIGQSGRDNELSEGSMTTEDEKLGSYTNVQESSI